PTIATSASMCSVLMCSLAAEDERRVHATEGEVVAHDVALGEAPALAAHVVELGAARVDLVEVQRRRAPAFPHRLDSDPGLERAAGAERMAQGALEQAHRYAIPEHARGGLTLGD